jgi:hypothetical protein
MMRGERPEVKVSRGERRVASRTGRVRLRPIRDPARPAPGAAGAGRSCYLQSSFPSFLRLQRVQREPG